MTRRQAGGATVRCVNRLWRASCLPAERAFARSLAEPERSQLQVLREVLRGTRGSDFGREHRLDRVDSVAAFRAAVPVRDWDALEPWSQRVARGEPCVLTRERVRVLEPTSGSTSARKLVPWTRGLQRQLRRAIRPWIADLFRAYPALLEGPAYWAVSPRLSDSLSGGSSPGGRSLDGRSEGEPSREETLPGGHGAAPPIGFEDDTAYLGGLAQRLAGAVLAVPGSVAKLDDQESWTRATLAGLLAARELRLVSVWHPSFLTLLLDGLAPRWEGLVRLVAEGGRLPAGAHRRPAAERARELERLGPDDPLALWPQLALVSAWGDGAAAPAFASLGERLPGVALQAKGLLATEATVSIPFRGAHPLALRSHYFEFEAEDGVLRGAHELAAGAEYTVVVSTAGGLLRYRLGDRVRVERHVDRTPSLRFLQRAGAVVDLRGEKLAEGFVAAVLAELLEGHAREGAVLVPQGGEPPHYRLALRGERPTGDLAARLDALLGANPHYAACRRSGQLGPVTVGAGSAPEAPLGGRKPRVLELPRAERES